jgi:hypothetical protein
LSARRANGRSAASRRRSLRLSAAYRAFSGQRNHGRGHTCHRKDSGFSRIAHRFPSLHHDRIDVNRKKHFAVSDHDVRELVSS